MVRILNDTDQKMRRICKKYGSRSKKQPLRYNTSIALAATSGPQSSTSPI
jgi:hypothetical protein